MTSSLRPLAAHVHLAFLQWLAWRAFAVTLVVNQAVTPLIGLAVWRLAARERVSRRASGCYLALATFAAAAMMGAGYWGGEMIIGK